MRLLGADERVVFLKPAGQCPGDFLDALAHDTLDQAGPFCEARCHR